MTKIEGHICLICDSIFSTKGCLKIHEDSIHKNTRFSCQYCGKQYAQNPEEEQPDCTHK